MTTQSGTIAELDFQPEIPCHVTHTPPVPATHTLAMCCPDCGDRWGFAVCGWCAIAFAQLTSCTNMHVHTFPEACKSRVQIGVTP